MKNNIIVLVTALLILFLINFSIWQKESHLNTGVEVYLELAPVDPRSLMQGDYMSLDYQLSRQILMARTGNSPAQINNSISEVLDVELVSPIDDFVVVNLDQHRVARFVRLDNDEPLLENQMKLQFRVRNNMVKFATNAYFFEEGDELVYRDARYGAFRVNRDGEVLLTHLLDEKFNLLGE
jgi:uncharacterized membrane-anchored protein